MLKCSMEVWKAIIVGIVQGLAEFLPVSSSGHIVLTQYLLGIRDVGAEHRPDLSFEIILHLGTLVSVLIFFKKSLWSLILSLFNNEMREERMMIVWLGVTFKQPSMFRTWALPHQGTIGIILNTKVSAIPILLILAPATRYNMIWCP